MLFAECLLLLGQPALAGGADCRRATVCTNGVGTMLFSLKNDRVRYGHLNNSTVEHIPKKEEPVFNQLPARCHAVSPSVSSSEVFKVRSSNKIQA